MFPSTKNAEDLAASMKCNLDRRCILCWPFFGYSNSSENSKTSRLFEEVVAYNHEGHGQPHAYILADRSSGFDDVWLHYLADLFGAEFLSNMHGACMYLTAYHMAIDSRISIRLPSLSISVLSCLR